MRIEILGIQFDNVTRLETLDWIETCIKQGGAQMICTPNANHIVLARYDTEFRLIIEQANLVVPDGMWVVYAARFLGTPLKENVGGRRLLPAFASRAAREGYRIFLLGGTSEDVAQQAAARLISKNPGLIIAGTYTPPFMLEFDEHENERMLDAVLRARPDVLFVCLGTPKQEKWIARNLHRLSATVSIGIGVTLDMIAGRVYEPPDWVSNIGMEWLVRFIQEPKRLWSRYIVGGSEFILLVLKQRFK